MDRKNMAESCPLMKVILPAVLVSRDQCIECIKHTMTENESIDKMFEHLFILQPSQPSGVKSSAVSLPNPTFTGQA